MIHEKIINENDAKEIDTLMLVGTGKRMRMNNTTQKGINMGSIGTGNWNHQKNGQITAPRALTVGK